MVRNAIRRKEHAEDVGRRPRHLDVRLARFSRRRGQGRQGLSRFRAPPQPIRGALLFSFGFDFAQARVVKKAFEFTRQPVRGCSNPWPGFPSCTYRRRAPCPTSLPPTRPERPRVYPQAQPLAGTEPLALPLELAFWALWHCRRASAGCSSRLISLRPPASGGPTSPLHAVPRRCRRRRRRCERRDATGQDRQEAP